MSKTNAKQPIYALTGLRFISAIIIVLFHYIILVLDYPFRVTLLAEQARAGVSLFFILSGFILYYNYHDWFQVHVDGTRFWQFARARFARVYPMHVVALLINTPIVLHFIITQPTQASQAYGDWLTPHFIGISWLANLTLVQVYLPLPIFELLWNVTAWSIASEFVFYIAFPFFIAYVLSRFKTSRSLLIFAIRLFAIETVALLAVVLVIFLWHSKNLDLVDFIPYRMPFFRIWEFFIGCTLGAVFVRDRQQVESHPLVRQLRNETCRNIVLALTLIGILTLVASSTLNVFVPLATLRRVLYWHVLYTPLLTLMIVTLAFGRTFLSPVLEHPWMLLLGEASYSLYITHIAPVVVLAQAKAKGVEIGDFWVAISIVLTIFASIGFLKFVEMPARRLLRGRKPIGVKGDIKSDNAEDQGRSQFP